MKKRLKRKCAKEILGVTKLNVKPGERLMIEVSDTNTDAEICNMASTLGHYLGCKVVVFNEKVNLSSINITEYEGKGSES